MMDKILDKLAELKSSDTNIAICFINSIYFKIRGKNILSHQAVSIKGLSNIETHGLFQIGTLPVGFMHKNDKTFLNIDGKLIVKSNFSLGRGCRLSVGKNAIFKVGQGCVTANTTFIIMHGIEIGDGCVISWGCEFLDEDFHKITYEGQEKKDNKIIIDNHVWIGSHVKILKGVRIGNNNVVAANSVVTKSFLEENVLIAGNPAKIIKGNISWTE
jgi:acetyltransferase-like isoleucine patch superfamily enzyme